MDMHSNMFVELVEVGPRDGLQNCPVILTTHQKKQLISLLQDANIKRQEVGSFVNPKLVPQMDGTSELFDDGNLSITNPNYLALIANQRGLSQAINANCKGITLVIALSNTFNQKNINRTFEESLNSMQEIVNIAKENNIFVRLDIATAFWCPFEGKMNLSALLDLIKYVDSLNIDEIIICDTIGLANPLQVTTTFKAINELNISAKLGAHFHDTYQMGLSNIYAALTEGVRIFDTAIAGLGGCPFAPGSSGNVATEVVNQFLERMGFQTGINQDDLDKAKIFINNLLNKTPESTIGI